MSVNGEIRNACNLYNITNIVIIVPSAIFTKERNNSQSIEQRKNKSAEKSLKREHYQSKGYYQSKFCKHSQGPKVANYLRKIVPPEVFNWDRNTPFEQEILTIQKIKTS